MSDFRWTRPGQPIPKSAPRPLGKSATCSLAALCALIFLLAGCYAPEGAATATPSLSPLATPPAPTLLPQPTPTPQGVMPTVLAECDLARASWQAYSPIAVAPGSSDTLYVLCAHADSPAGESACVALVDPEQARVTATWPLSGNAWHSLAASADRIYALVEEHDSMSLVVLDSSSGQLLRHRSLGFWRPLGGLWLDEAHQRLYLPCDDQLRVLDDTNLEQVAELSYPFEAVDRHVRLVPDRDRLYLALSNALYAYRASDLALLWQIDVPTHRIVAMVDSDVPGMLALQSTVTQDEMCRTQVHLIAEDGDIVGQYHLTGSCSMRLLAVEGAGHRYVWQMADANNSHSPSSLVVTDEVGVPTGEPLALPEGSFVQTCGGRWYVIDRAGHRLLQYDQLTMDAPINIVLGVELAHLAQHQDQPRLFVNDTAGALYEMDTARLEDGEIRLVRSVAAGKGELALDHNNGLLLVAGWAGLPNQVGVIDLSRFSVTGVITGGDRVALDTRHAHAIVGNHDREGPTLVWDLMNAQHVGTLPARGIPAYNPLRDEIMVGGEGVLLFDAGSLRPTGSIPTPQEQNLCADCVGQTVVTDLRVLPSSGLLRIETGMVSAGKGTGWPESSRLYDLETLQEEPWAATWVGTGDGLAFAPSNGVVMQNLQYARYISRQNLVARRAADGMVLDWRDGLSLELLSPDGRIGYVADGDRWLALATDGFQPLGYTRRYAVQQFDAAHEVFFAFDGSRLVMLRPKWGDPLAVARPEAVQLTQAIRSVALFAGEQEPSAVFAVSGNRLFRSLDGGRNWHILRGGLPQADQGPSGHLVVALSPAFAEDRTLLAGGWDGARGLGVWRSTDSGDTWQPLWQGLQHLRVERLVVSQRYVEDGEVLAYCLFDDLLQFESGRSVYRFGTAAARWHKVAQAPHAPGSSQILPPPEALWSRRNTTSGRTQGDWPDVESSKLADLAAAGEYVVGQATVGASASEVDHYLMTNRRLYRLESGSSHWQMVDCSKLAQGSAVYTAMAASYAPAKGTSLALGREDGAVDLVEAAKLPWQPD